MVIRFDKSYVKQYDKLSAKIRRQADASIRLFAKDPRNSRLRDHALTGKYRGYRSINITGGIRALYRQKGDTTIIFAFVGSHSQLYK